MVDKLNIPETPPFKAIILSGKKAAGKTLTALGSPWAPIHILDTELSSIDYFEQMEWLLHNRYILHPFTRADVPTFGHFQTEVGRILKSGETYGTLILDTAGQLTSWVAEDKFLQYGDKADKQSQLVWGKVRDSLRDLLLKLSTRAKLLVLTGHERQYGSVISPRMNPALLELVGLQVRLVRPANAKLPDGNISARLPLFPPLIRGFRIVSLLKYYTDPADWDNLKDEEKQQEELSLPAFEDLD